MKMRRKGREGTEKNERGRKEERKKERKKERKEDRGDSDNLGDFYIVIHDNFSGYPQVNLKQP